VSFDPINASAGFLVGVTLTALLFLLFGMLTHFYQLADQVQDIIEQVKGEADDPAGDQENGTTEK
jgi:hypothetical protein|tara:strand:+ start:1277 stop:1471 length:195 start_codon:yes stop_codon:yes gene_type:complete